jgi:hypothetical protein
VLGTDRLLEEERLVRRQRGSQLHRLPRLPQAGVGVEGELPVVRMALPDLAEVAAQFGCDQPEPRRVQVDAVGTELEGGEAVLGMEALRAVEELGGVRGGVQPRVDADPVAHRSSQQLVDGETGSLPRDVPQRVVDGGDGGESHRSRREAGGLEEELVHGRGPGGVPAAQLVREVLDHRREREVGAVVVDLRPPVQPVVGGDPDKDARPVPHPLQIRADAVDAGHRGVLPSVVGAGFGTSGRMRTQNP